MRRVAVIDIGKSNAKVALVDLETLAELSVRKMPNRPLTDGPYPHCDVEGIWAFILESLAAFGREGVEAISITTHGATAALLDAEGQLTLPVLDYEHAGPDGLRSQYELVRPSFAESGSPTLPNGLNLGAQLFWQARSFPDAFSATGTILTYPQYWAFRLTRVTASEATSLGCHTDLWNPEAGRFSTLVSRMSWEGLFPPLRPASATLGPILPEVAQRTGLAPSTPVLCGIHDSNASLLPHLLQRKAPFTVISTGTWVVAMAVGGAKVVLDPQRDTLINVNALGDPVPSARFMGGREYEMLTSGREARWSEADVRSVIEGGIMLLPSVQPGCGPYPHARSRWIAPSDPSPGQRAVASAFYLSLMTATCLELIGAGGSSIVEGPFAANALYVDMLEAATGRAALPQEGQATGTCIGAALLAGKTRLAPPQDQPRERRIDGQWARYAEDWRRAVAAA